MVKKKYRSKTAEWVDTNRQYYVDKAKGSHDKHDIRNAYSNDMSAFELGATGYGMKDAQAMVDANSAVYGDRYKVRSTLDRHKAMKKFKRKQNIKQVWSSEEAKQKYLKRKKDKALHRTSSNSTDSSSGKKTDREWKKHKWVARKRGPGGKWIYDYGKGFPDEKRGGILDKVNGIKNNMQKNSRKFVYNITNALYHR